MCFLSVFSFAIKDVTGAIGEISVKSEVQIAVLRSPGGGGPLEWGIPTPVFFPGESHGQRSLEGYSPQDHKEATQYAHTHTHLVNNWLHRWPRDRESACQGRRSRRCGCDPWVGMIPWRRKWQPTPVFLSENPMDREAQWAPVHGITKSQTQLK